MEGPTVGAQLRPAGLAVVTGRRFRHHRGTEERYRQTAT